jgi:hypothetical protein
VRWTDPRLTVQDGNKEMARSGIEQLLYMIDLAFEGDPSVGCDRNWHSLVVNLESVQDQEWHWVPQGAKRSIFDIVQHVGACKYVYESHAFGDGSMHWDKPGSIPNVTADASPVRVLEWLQEGHTRLRNRVTHLEDDAELLLPRRSNWGVEYETRWLINTMIQHDLYHAGEINHIRALAQGNDA